jgi:hypothetical protein
MPTSATAKKDRKDKVASPQRAVNDNAAWKTALVAKYRFPRRRLDLQMTPNNKQNLRSAKSSHQRLSERISKTPTTVCSRFSTTRHGHGRLASTEAVNRGPANDPASSTAAHIHS